MFRNGPGLLGAAPRPDIISATAAASAPAVASAAPASPDERAADEWAADEWAVDERTADERTADERAVDERAVEEQSADDPAAYSAAVSAGPSAMLAATVGGTDERIVALERLMQLRVRGALTDDEFNHQKAAVLGR